MNRLLVGGVVAVVVAAAAPLAADLYQSSRTREAVEAEAAERARLAELQQKAIEIEREVHARSVARARALEDCLARLRDRVVAKRLQEGPALAAESRRCQSEAMGVGEAAKRSPREGVSEP